MSRSVFVHSTLLAVALIASYLVWTREPTPSSDKTVPLLNLRRLDRVRYESPGRNVEVARKRDAAGDYYWVQVETVKKTRPRPPRRPPQPPRPPAHPKHHLHKDGPTDAGAHPAAPPAPPAPPPAPKTTVVRKTTEFKGTEEADKLFKALARLRALRSIENPGKEKLKEFGLAAGKTRLKVTSGSSSRAFLVGGRTFGNQDNYIQDVGDKRVYVIRPQPLKDLEGAQHRLFERRLHTFRLQDVDRVVIKAKDATRTLTQHNRDSPKAAYWTEQDKAAGTQGADKKRKQAYRNWLNKLHRVNTREYVSANAKPAGLKPVFEITYHDRGKQIGFLKLSEHVKVAPKTVGAIPQGDRDYYGLTENTRALVKLTKALARDLVRDLDQVVKD